MIPQEWDSPTLGDLFTFKNGLNKAKKFFGYGTPIVNYMDVYGNRRLFACELRGRVSLSKEELKNFEVKKGDVFFTRTSETAAEVGMSSVMLDETVDTVFSGFVLRARPRDDSLDDRFKQYCFSTTSVRKQITSRSTETTRALTSGRALSVVMIARPPKPEQRAIADALGNVDAMLGALDATLTKKRALKQAAMQQLLTGHTRLPGFYGDWNVTQLSAVCSMKSGEGITSAHIDLFSQYPCYGGNGLRGFASRFTHEGAYALIGRQGALCGNVIGVEGRFFASEHAIVATARPQTDIRWLTYVLGEMRLNQYTESSAQPGLSVSKLLTLHVVVPPTRDEQSAIAEVLSDMDAEIEALEARRDKTRALKQAMMQELLVGRTRLI